MVWIVCPTCYWENPGNAVECEKCKSTLMRQGGTKQLSEHTLPRYAQAPLVDVPRNTVVLVVEGYQDQPIHIPPRRKIFLGRQFPSENPPLDLSPYGAHEAGVSRQHAVLTVMADGCVIEDLASTNGTWLNNMRIAPYLRYEVKSADRIQLGHMPLYVYFDFSV